MPLISYDTYKYPFRQLIENLLGEKNLEGLNMTAEVFTRENDQSTPWHRLFYASFMGSEFQQAYLRLLKEVIQPNYQEQLLYQKIPTFRVALPGNLAVGEWHKDTEYGHDEAEMNYWLPFTKAYDTNTVWIEQEAQNMEYGQMLEFSGSQLHGNKINETGQTRVSMDFRVLPESRFQPSEKITVSSKIPFTIGGYWSRLE